MRRVSGLLQMNSKTLISSMSGIDEQAQVDVNAG